MCNEDMNGLVYASEGSTVLHEHKPLADVQPHLRVSWGDQLKHCERSREKPFQRHANSQTLTSIGALVPRA